MPQQKALLDERLRRIPFSGPQYDFVKTLIGTLDRVCDKLELLQLREQVYLGVLNELTLWHHKDSRAYLPTPSGKLRSGVTYHASGIDLKRIGRYDKNELREIINGLNGLRG